MSPRPRKAPNARLTLWAPRRPRVSAISPGLGRAVSSGFAGRGRSPVTSPVEPGSTGVVGPVSPTLGVPVDGVAEPGVVGEGVDVVPPAVVDGRRLSLVGPA